VQPFGTDCAQVESWHGEKSDLISISLINRAQEMTSLFIAPPPPLRSLNVIKQEVASLQAERSGDSFIQTKTALRIFSCHGTHNGISFIKEK
jgi:hypothetical protein